jgi:V/A-type H+-transporting ATPase subunit B
MPFAELTVTGAATRLEGPLLFLERTVRVGLNSAVEVIGADGVARTGRVALVDDDRMVVEVLESTSGLGLGDTRVRVHDAPLTFGVGPGMLGRVFNSIGLPVDGGPPIPAHEFLPVSGWSINPASRALPRDFIETGISTIDLMNSLVRGQKLPIFSGGGLPHDRMATEVAQRARLIGEAGGGFAVVFVGIGVSHDTADAFRHAMEETGAISRTVMFLNRADEPSAQRLLTPRYALTAAEYLAFVQGLHVLVVMTDMTNYCEALREVSASHGEVPSRKGYPGYMYSDLASIYERAGCIRGLPGTLTQLPILTMPADDIGHPIPDLTGYITEGQIVLDRELDRRGIYPPVRVLPSLSRLMSSGTGKGYARGPSGARQPAVRRLRARHPGARTGERDGRGGPDRGRPAVPGLRRPVRGTHRQAGYGTDARGEHAHRLGAAAHAAGGRADAAVARADRALPQACLNAPSPRPASPSSNSATSGGWCARGTRCSTRSGCCSPPRSWPGCGATAGCGWAGSTRSRRRGRRSPPRWRAMASTA